MNLDDIAQGLSPELASVLPDPKSLPSVTYRTDRVRGWLEIGQFYTCIPDAAYPWDPVVMKAILEIAPDAVPMWVRWVFHTPLEDSKSEIVVYGRHALGRKIWHPRGPVQEFPVTMPMMPCQGLTFEKPNKLWFIHEGNRGKVADLPGSYLGFDDTILDRVKRSAVGFQMSDQEYTAHLRDVLIEGPRRRLEEKRRAFAEEEEYAQRELERYAVKVMDGVSDAEIAEHEKSAGHRKWEPKPMVVVP